LDDLGAAGKAEAEVVLISAGCYQHKRQWRRRRRRELSDGSRESVRGDGSAALKRFATPTSRKA
jgi:hypothetical protein